MARTPEGRVKHAVKKKLEERAVYYFMPVQNGMGRAGVPDFVCCVPTVVNQEMVGKKVGLFLGIETKAPGKRGSLTPNQHREIQRIHEAAGEAVVVDEPDQLKDVLT